MPKRNIELGTCQRQVGAACCLSGMPKKGTLLGSHAGSVLGFKHQYKLVGGDVRGAGAPLIGRVTRLCHHAEAGAAQAFAD